MLTLTLGVILSLMCLGFFYYFTTIDLNYVYKFYNFLQRIKVVNIFICTDASDSSYSSMCLAMTLVIGPCLDLLPSSPPS